MAVLKMETVCYPKQLQQLRVKLDCGTHDQVLDSISEYFKEFLGNLLQLRASKLRRFVVMKLQLSLNYCVTLLSQRTANA
jgi:methyl coenzyme M reductase subunit C-like uncharacterized protein (methanogenesis marker protein 7)